MMTRFLLMFLLGFYASVTMASSNTLDSPDDSQYQEGVKAYVASDFLNCAIKMETFKNTLSKFSRDARSKINFYRSVCNGNLGYYGYVLPLIKEINLSDLSNEQVEIIENLKKEMQGQIFKIGFLAAKNKDFLSCATQMESIKDPSDLFEKKIKNKILFYRTYCNAKIGYNAFAAALFDYIDSDDLTENEGKIYSELKILLYKELEAKNRIYKYLTFYGGSIGYSPKITKSKATLYGIATTFVPSLGGWDFNLAADKVSLIQVNSGDNYTQTQVNLSVGKSFLTYFSIHPFFSNISTSNSAGSNGGNEGNVMGIMGSYINSLTSKISLEYDQSTFPSFIIGKTTTREYVISWDKTLVSDSNYTIASKLLIESVHPQAPLNKDPSSGFVLKSHYERYALDLNFFFTNFQLGLSGWTGAEALGSRNLGSVIFNALEERSQGLGANIKFDLKPSTTSFKFSYASETILNPNSTDIKASTFVGALTFIF